MSLAFIVPCDITFGGYKPGLVLLTGMLTKGIQNSLEETPSGSEHHV